MSDIRIRVLTEEDLEEAGNVVKSALLPRLKSENLPEAVIKEIISRYDPDNFREEVNGTYFLVAEDQSTGKLIGVGGLRKNEGSLIPNRLTTFFVNPEYQRKGICRMLYENVKEEALKNGCKKLVVSSSPFAEPIYEHFGFKKIKVNWKKYPNGGKSYNVWMEQKL